MTTHMQTLICKLYWLADLDPAWRPAAPNLPDQSKPHLVPEKHRPGTFPEAFLRLKTPAQAPFFQASCRSGSASGDCWRGTFFFKSNRSKTWRIPQ